MTSGVPDHLRHPLQFDDDPARTDVDAVWAFLSREAYWGRWRTRDDIERQLASAWRVVGCFDGDEQVGFARAVSDGVALAWLADVYVVASHRGRGIGRRLVAAMIDDGPGRDFRWLLNTADAHSLYREFGFGPPDSSIMDRPARVVAETSERDAQFAAIWAGAHDRDEDAVVADVLALAARYPADDPVALFETASAYDFCGREAEAEPAYRAALAGGLDAVRRPQAVIQLASTVRNLGRPDETAHDLGRDAEVSGQRDAATAFRALALVDLGRSRQAVAELLHSLAAHLPQYGGSLRGYADALGPSVELRVVGDDDTLAALTAAAQHDADPDDVTPPLGAGWTTQRLDWLRSYHLERVDGLAGEAHEIAWAVVLDGAVCGGARLRFLGEARYEVGLWLVRAARRRGLGAAVVAAVLDVARPLGAREIVASTTPANTAAIGLLRRANFTLDASDDAVTASFRPRPAVDGTRSCAY